MNISKSLMVAASGLKAQGARMRLIAENIANATSSSNSPSVDPYRRKMVDMRSRVDKETGVHMVMLGRVRYDKSDFKTQLQPGHPAADENGYVKMPNVNPLIEMVDMREAQRSYEANLNVIRSTRQMITRTIDILRG